MLFVGDVMPELAARARRGHGRRACSPGSSSRTRGSASRSTRSAATPPPPPPTGSTSAATRFWSFTIAGVFFGAAGLFVTAKTGSGDPLIGAPMLLKIFAAVVLGGTLIGGGRGGASARSSAPDADDHRQHLPRPRRAHLLRADRRGRVLILAVLGFTAAAICRSSALLQLRARARRPPPERGVAHCRSAAGDSRRRAKLPGWLVRNAATLRYHPAGLCPARRRRCSRRRRSTAAASRPRQLPRHAARLRAASSPCSALARAR